MSGNTKLEMICWRREEQLGLDSEDTAAFILALQIPQMAAILPEMMLDVTDDKLAWFSLDQMLDILTQCGYISQVVPIQE